MKNITLSADEKLIEAARARARDEQTTLNEVFRSWLEDYARAGDRRRRYEELMSEIRGKMKISRMPTREEMNAR